MSKLIKLIVVCLTICSCSGGALTIPDKIKPCGPPLGPYEMVLQGTLPNKSDPDLGKVIEYMCPPDMFLGFKDTIRISITQSDPEAACGTYMRVDKKTNSVSKIVSTREGISGNVLMLVKIDPTVSCFAFFSLTFKKLP